MFRYAGDEVPYEKQPLGWRMGTRILFWRLRVKRFFKDTLPREIAFHLPRRISYWALIREASRASVNYPNHVMSMDLQWMMTSVDPDLAPQAKDWQHK